MSDAAHKMEDFRTKAQENWAWFLILGIVLIIGGGILIAAPLATSIAVTLLIALVFFVGGLVQIYNAFKTKAQSGFLWNLITGIIAVAGGILIYLNPLAGTFALTIVIAAIFIAQGVSQLILAFRIRPHEGWVWVAIAGLASLLAGFLIWSGMPGSAVWALGLIAGISVLLNGWSYVAIALAARASKNG
ncbi:HdeD family acid-resistance protein [Roseibium sp. RKSG952]|uniref:HdeD family acid-resistance protein n=1 Tax=Roseibium sp. RKSG952 TaxID=2529384 RepID=UPI0012BBE60C|nr:HdeD family acid-resistance protein [Roseibium sp. RKSG952]MTH96584.1 HdeD family acid-resistance protein [Roseibium sp. RKSG952]